MQVEQRGYRTVGSRAELERLGFTAPQRRVPALLIPLHGVHGEIAGYQIRPDTPRQDRNGKVVKYETPGKTRMVLDVPPAARGKLSDPATPLFITEGVKKADSAATRGLCCVALLGVWNWRGTNADGGKVALVEWDSIALNGRVVYVVFDSDVAVKSQVHAAMERLKAYLEHRRAAVRVVYLPGGEGGAKVGLDDFFVAGHGVDELLSYATDTLRVAPLDPIEQEPPYASAMAGFVRFLASRRAATASSLSDRVRQIRSEMSADGVHRRTPGICADLLFGVETFLDFAVAAQVLDGAEALAVIGRVRAGLAEAIDVQRSDHTEAEPAERFLALLQSALLSGEAHVCARDGRHPSDPSPWGWARLTGAGEPLETDAWTARGKCVGWLDGEELYLDQDAAVRAACAVGAQSGDPIAVTPGTIARRLRDRGLLRSTSPDGEHVKVQVSIGGARRWVLHLDATVVLGVATAPVTVARGVPVVVEAPPPQSPNDHGPGDDWECPRCGGADAWVSRVNGDRLCRSCVPPVPGAELVGPTSSSFERGGSSS